MNNRFRAYDPRSPRYSMEDPYAPHYAMPAMAETPVRDNTIFVYPQNLKNALSLIQQAIGGEAEDRLFYSWLIENASSDEDRKIIAGIRDDEIAHFGLFRQLYQDLTGKMAPPAPSTAFTPPDSYCSGLSNALLGEQNAVRKYRQILYALQDRVQQNMLTEIITDELRHGILYNYLYTKNGCSGR